MNIYKFRPSSSNKYHCLDMREEDLDRLDEVGERSLLESWEPLHLELYTKGKRKPTDFPCLQLFYMIFTEKSYGVFKDFIAATQGMEALPCTGTAGNLYLLNLWDFSVDCFHAKASEVERYSAGGPIREISIYQFHANKIPDELFFQIPEMPLDIFVTQNFMDLARDNDLAGLDLVRIWPNDTLEDAEGTPRPAPAKESQPVVAPIKDLPLLNDEILSGLLTASEVIKDTEIYEGSILAAKPELEALNSMLAGMILGESTSWPDDLLAIGSDGAGNFYALNEQGAVIAFYHEAESFEEIAKDLAEFPPWLSQWAC